MDERREILYIKSGGLCAICHKPLGIDYQRHHGGAHDTKGNNENYPLYTKSLLGWLPEHGQCHTENPSSGNIPEEQIKLWEELLRAFLNLIKAGAKINLTMLLEEFRIMLKERRR